MSNHRATMWKALCDGPATIGEIGAASRLHPAELGQVLEEWQYDRQWIKPVRSHGVQRYALTEAGRGHLMTAMGLFHCDRTPADRDAFTANVRLVSFGHGQ